MKVSFDFDVPLDRLGDPSFTKTLSEFLLALGGKAASPAILSSGASPETASEKKRGRPSTPKPSVEPPFVSDPAAIQHLLDNVEGDAKVLMQEMYQRGSLNMEEARSLLGGNRTDRNVGGTIGAVKRWASENGMYPPYLREKDAAGKSVWHWLGTAFVPSTISTSLSTQKDTSVRKETRGRKKKEASLSETASPSHATKKSKLGRPRKTSSSVPATSDTDSAPVEPKKRGRPRKHPVAAEATPEAPKKRGRPPKNPSAPPQLHTNKMSPMGGKKSTFLNPQKQTSVKTTKKGRPRKSQRDIKEIEKILAKVNHTMDATVAPTDSTTAIVPIGQKGATKTKGRKKTTPAAKKTKAAAKKTKVAAQKTKVAAKKTKAAAKKTKVVPAVTEPEKPVTDTTATSAAPAMETTMTQEKRPESIPMSEIPASVGKKGWVKKSARQAKSSGTASELRRIVSLPTIPQK